MRRRPTKPFAAPTKPFSCLGEDVLKRGSDPLTINAIKQRSSIMLAFFTMLYREYCRARLAEMRKYQLTHPGGGN